jgi:hypothetical protein
MRDMETHEVHRKKYKHTYYYQNLSFTQTEKSTERRPERKIQARHPDKRLKRRNMGPGVVMRNCNPSYTGVGGRRIVVQCHLGKVSLRIYVKN